MATELVRGVTSPLNFLTRSTENLLKVKRTSNLESLLRIPIIVAIKLGRSISDGTVVMSIFAYIYVRVQQPHRRTTHV